MYATIRCAQWKHDRNIDALDLHIARYKTEFYYIQIKCLEEDGQTWFLENQSINYDIINDQFNFDIYP